MATDAHKNEFSQLVEQLAVSLDMTILDALTHVVEDNQMDYSNVKQLISKRLLELLTKESINSFLIAGDRNPATIAEFVKPSTSVVIQKNIKFVESTPAKLAKIQF